MTKAQPKIALSQSRDIPFDKLILSQSNVRHIKAGVGIEELAEDIARHTLLQSVTVRPLLDESGAETGVYEIPAGGRRFRALDLLVKQKRLARTAPIPCIIRTDGIAEEDSLAENVQRLALHPLDQFRAFLALREKGQSEEEIAAAFFVAPSIVKQRLRLASVSPKLLDVYAEDGMTLDQLMAFTVNADHERQEQVFERLASSYTKEAYHIRRMLTEGAVRASDKRARFVGLDAYAEAGGTILRDLFQTDDGGWLQDAGLLDLMVAERLRDEAIVVRGEGWKWTEVAPDFAYGHVFGLRQLRGDALPLTDAQQAEYDALHAKLAGIEQSHAGSDDLPQDVEQRLGEIEAALAEFDHRTLLFDPVEIARAGAFVSIDADGALKIERGYIRPADELPIEPEQPVEAEAEGDADGQWPTARADNDDVAASGEVETAAEREEDEGLKPIPDRLLTELTAHRTLALRDAVGSHPDVAYLAVLHTLCLQTFYLYTQDSCVEIAAKSVAFGAQAPGLNDSASARSIEARREALHAELPANPAELWDRLAAFDAELRARLLAHCVGQTVNAVHEAWNRRPKALAHADRLARAVDLDMVVAGWRATADTFLGRVTKARIVQAVREGRGEADAERIVDLKKDAMVEEASRLLANSGWLPEPLRTPERAVSATDTPVETDAMTIAEPTGEQSAAIDGEPAMVDPERSAEDDEVAFEPLAIAAE